MKEFISVIVCLLTLVSCSGSKVEEDGSLDPPTITGYVQINELEYAMRSGGYSWEKKQGLRSTVVQTDHAGSVQLAQDYDEISVMPNDVIHIDVQKNPRIQVYSWNDETPEEIKVNGNQITVPENKGQYIYEVIATWDDGVAGWDRGEISYTFVVDVQ